MDIKIGTKIVLLNNIHSGDENDIMNIINPIGFKGEEARVIDIEDDMFVIEISTNRWPKCTFVTQEEIKPIPLNKLN